MSVAYKLLYGVGFTPWEQIAALPEVVDRLGALFDREAAEHRRTPRRALDLGCGSGFWTVELARRGWEVTGVDIVPKALRRARERVRDAGVEARLIAADATRLDAGSLGSGFSFLLDLGLFHDELSDGQRAHMGRGVTALAAPGATMLMVAWAPARRRFLPRGASRDDIGAAYPYWSVIEEEAVDVTGAPFYRQARDADPRLYRLRRFVG